MEEVGVTEKRVHPSISHLRIRQQKIFSWPSDTSRQVLVKFPKKLMTEGMAGPSSPCSRRSRRPSHLSGTLALGKASDLIANLIQILYAEYSEWHLVQKDQKAVVIHHLEDEMRRNMQLQHHKPQIPRQPIESPPPHPQIITRL